MAELVTFGETMLRLSPPLGHRLETSDELAVAVGGAESNVAVAAARLGCHAAWISALPANPLGRRVERTVRGNGVETAIAWSEGARQGWYFLEHGPAPRAGSVLYDREGTPIRSLEPEDLPGDVIRGAGMVFTSGITPALSETLVETTTWFLEAGERSAFDLNYRSKLWSEDRARSIYRALLPAVDVVFAPVDDVRTVLRREGSPAEVARELRSEYECDTVVVTDGARGAVAAVDGKTLEQPAFEAETVDPIGSGDAFVGGYLARYLHGSSPQEALRYGAATAALKRTIPGDMALVTAEEVDDVIDRRGGELSR